MQTFVMRDGWIFRGNARLLGGISVINKPQIVAAPASWKGPKPGRVQITNAHVIAILEDDNGED